MSETAIGTLTAADLTPENYGCLVVWEERTEWGTVLREVVFDELRRWIYDGVRRVELIDFTPGGPGVGKAHFLDGTTPIGVGRRVRKPRRRRWQKEPLREWSELEPRVQEHDPRCISLTDSEFREVCDCKTLRMIDAHGSSVQEPEHANGRKS